MKKTLIHFLALASIVAVSCSDDDSTPDLVNVDNNPSEEISLNATEVSGNIIIDGATKVQGNAPEPNGDLTFKLSDTKQSAFQKFGFDIVLEAPDNYAGAYIQLKGNDGVAGEYFDVPAGAGKSLANKITKKASPFALKSNKTLMNNEITIDVDFKEVPPGKFCYLICVYDGNGFVSQPSEVCVDVEAWGGNPNLVGSWNLTKTEELYEGKEETYIVGEEDCDDQSVFCQNQTEIVVENAYCFTTLSAEIVFNEDGTFRFDSTGTDRSIDYSQTSENCSPVYEEVEEEISYLKGRWAYDEEEKKLTIVAFESYYDYSSEPEPELETYENGDLLLNGDLNFENINAFTTYEEEIFEGELETIKAFFSRK